ncbi:MAG: DUF151 domain-containing protein [Chloroflexota bacterium]|nr:DUF151 domain-containing protein [Chloroflexota bacterium]
MGDPPPATRSRKWRTADSHVETLFAAAAIRSGSVTRGSPFDTSLGATRHAGFRDLGHGVCPGRVGTESRGICRPLQRHRPLLIAACRRVLRDPSWADDAAHEAIVVALLNLHRLRKPERFGAWLCGIGLQVCRAWLRLRRQDPWSLEAQIGGRPVREPVDSQPSPLAQAEERELAVCVRSAIDALPSGQRAAVALFYLDGLTYAEVSVTLGIEVGAVKTRLHNARRGLAKTLWTTWKEHTVATDFERSAITWADVELDDVMRVSRSDPPFDRSILILKETGGDRLLPIWVGAFEGDAAAILLVGAETPRPLTFPFTARLVEAAGGAVQEIRIARLVDETFFAEVIVKGARGTQAVDARPSDAVALALVTHVPIRVERGVLDAAGRTRDELAQTRPEGIRSARGASDAIRTRARELRKSPTHSQLF